MVFFILIEPIRCNHSDLITSEIDSFIIISLSSCHNKNSCRRTELALCDETAEIFALCSAVIDKETFQCEVNDF